MATSNPELCSLLPITHLRFDEHVKQLFQRTIDGHKKRGDPHGNNVVNHRRDETVIWARKMPVNWVTVSSRDRSTVNLRNCLF
jgi:hypothetical protein